MDKKSLISQLLDGLDGLDKRDEKRRLSLLSVNELTAEFAACNRSLSDFADGDCF